MKEELYTFELPGAPIKWRRLSHEFRDKKGQISHLQNDLVTKIKLLLKSQFHNPVLEGKLSLDTLFVFSADMLSSVFSSLQLAYYEQFIMECLENVVILDKGFVFAKTSSKVLGKIPGTFITVRRCH